MYANTSDETTAQCTFTRDMFFPPSHRTADAVSLHVVVLGWPLANDNLHNLFVCNGYAKRTYQQQQQQRDSPYSHGLLCDELTRHRNHLSRSGCRRSRCIRNLSAPKPTQYVRRWVDERWCEWWYQYYGPKSSFILLWNDARELWCSPTRGCIKRSDCSQPPNLSLQSGDLHIFALRAVIHSAVRGQHALVRHHQIQTPRYSLYVGTYAYIVRLSCPPRSHRPRERRNPPLVA